MAAPSGERGGETSIGEPLSSREASRKVTSSSSLTNRIVTVMPGPTTPSVRGGPPTRAVSRICCSPAIRPPEPAVRGVGRPRRRPPLYRPLLVLGGVVPAVLAQVPFLPGRLDLLRD